VRGITLDGKHASQTAANVTLVTFTEPFIFPAVSALGGAAARPRSRFRRGSAGGADRRQEKPT
jgi:hypothetical protein